MFKRRLLWKLYGAHLVVVLLCTLAVGANALGWIRPFYRDQKRQELLDKARLVEPEILDALSRSPANVDALCKDLGKISTTRVTVLGLAGEVLGDSQAALPLPSHKDRPEVIQAMSGQTGVSVRWSDTLRADLLYVAVPLMADGKLRGVLRLAVALSALDRALEKVTGRIVVGIVTVAALASMLALAISRRISRPLEEMRRGVERFAEGDFSHKLIVTGSDEIGSLARSLNAMAGQLDDRVQTVMRLEREIRAVLSSMTEGVLAVDHDDRVISFNQAALALLGAEDREVRGRSLSEVVRNPYVQDFVARVRAGRGVSEGEVAMERPGLEQRLQLHGSILHDAQERDIGVLVVIRDVTRLRHLETVRRDFVANVSHELKTPITAIQGSIETLSQGALNDPPSARRFLEMMARQTQRMSAIVEDLLSLASLEETADSGKVEMAICRVADVLQAAVNICRHKAEERSVQVRLLCPDDLWARLNPQLLEQAVANLLDNAIKYSEPGREVQIEAARHGLDLSIAVRDQGCGIPPEHLNRIFERFYCVDRARSRKLGGTGLGLSIVKHVAQAHGGSVTVESTLGQGSTFTMNLPVVSSSPQ